MTPEMFNKVFDKTIKEMEETLCKKGKEYAFEEDRLFNFKQAARISEEPVPKAIWGMAMKHLVSVIDIIEGRLDNTEYNRNEKIGDLLNYLILLKASLIEIEIEIDMPIMENFGL